MLAVVARAYAQPKIEHIFVYAYGYSNSSSETER